MPVLLIKSFRFIVLIKYIDCDDTVKVRVKYGNTNYLTIFNINYYFIYKI